MPAVAVVGAVAAIAVAVEVGTTFAIIAAVGATIGAIGAVTGVKELAIAGAIVGAVGAIGGLASSAGLFGEAGGIFGSGAGAAAGEAATGAGSFAADSANMGGFMGIDQEIATWASYGGKGGLLSGAPVMTDAGTFGPLDRVVDSVSGSVTNVGDAGNITSSATANAASPNVTPAGVAEPTAAMGDVPGVPIAQGDASAINPATPSATAPAAPEAPTVTGNPDPGTTVTGNVGMPQDAGIPGSYQAAANAANVWGKVTVPGTEKSVLGGIWDFVKNSGTLGTGVLMAGGSFLSGATSGLTPAQIKAYEAQAQQNVASSNLANQQASLTAQQLQNIREPIPMASRQPQQPPVTGAPAAGLLNRPPQPQVAA